MFKKLVVFVAVVAVFFGANTVGVSAAAAGDYHAEFSSTNLYGGDNLLIYHFTGLDPDSDYVWLLQGVSISGGPNEALGLRFLDGDGATTTHTITFDYQDFNNQNGTIFSGPAQVIDNFGNVVGKHYILGMCADDSYEHCGEQEWSNPGGENGVDNRVLVRKPEYGQMIQNVDGWFHEYDNSAFVTVGKGDYLILHYLYDPAIVPTDEIYQIYDIATSALLYRFYLDDLYTYNDDVRRVTLGETIQTYNFVILTTNGVTPDWINHDQNAEAWTLGDNPHSASFEYGVYDYERTTAGGASIDDGESVFIVSKGGRTEWAIGGKQESIGAGNDIRLVVESKTEAVWTDGYLDHELNDTQEGSMDGDNYAYSPYRTTSYPVGIIEGFETSVWVIYPTTTNMTTASLSERRFFFEHDYAISSSMLIVDRVEDTLEGFGFDTPMGRALAMLLLMVVIMLFMSSRRVRGFVPFALAFLFIGGGWLIIGLGDGLTSVLFGISAVVVIFLLIQHRKRSEGME